MTHQIGDKGQRYQCEYSEESDYAAEARGEPWEYRIIGWCGTYADAMRMCAGWELRPGVIETRIIDREPWTHGLVGVSDEGPGRLITITTEDGYDIALLHHFRGGGLKRRPNAVADAARIVKTWNAHDDLVSALQRVDRIVSANLGHQTEKLADIVPIIREALASVKKP